MKKGFTLVELSIVLVIIGLLIGGILVGQSMIGTAKIQAQVQQIGQFDAGVINFKTKYNYLPGDAPAFGGDGDGIIERYPGDNNNALNTFEGEIAKFWGNIFPDKYTANATRHDPIIDIDVPGAKLGMKNSFFIAEALCCSVSNSWQADPNNKQNVYGIVSPNNYRPGDTFTSTGTGLKAVKPADLLALDRKLDNGLADSGSVIAGSFASSNAGLSYDSIPECSTGSTYLINNNTFECTPVIRIGTQAGVVQ